MKLTREMLDKISKLRRDGYDDGSIARKLNIAEYLVVQTRLPKNR